MKVGYARVSTHEQNLSLQKDALKHTGCAKIFQDQVSGAKKERLGLQAATEYVREGDTLVVWRLNRLGRSLKHLIETVTTLEERGVGYQSLQESIDFLRLSIKYILFDLEATRRENQYLRKMLEETDAS